MLFLSFILLLLGVFSTAEASNFPEKIGLQQLCERVMHEVQSMDVEDLLEQGINQSLAEMTHFTTFNVSDQLLNTAKMCEQYLKDINPDLTHLSLAQRRPERVRLNALNEQNFRSNEIDINEEDTCILKVYSIGHGRGRQFDIEGTDGKYHKYKPGFPVRSIRTVGKCCWIIKR